MNFERTPSSPPVIKPLQEEIQRPLWSIMIPTYNCASFLPQTLQSILVQDTGSQNMQIEVVDDCSKDGDVESIVKEIGRGRIDFFSQKSNVGNLRNFETCINRSRGHLIHLLHGDDMVKPGFYEEIEILVRKYSQIGAAFTGFSGIDENGNILYHNNMIQNYKGIIDDWLSKVSQNQRLQACAMVVKRSVYEQVGGFFGVHYGEDWEMWVRIAAQFPVAYSPSNLALYRIHANSISARYVSSGQNVKDIKKVINIIQDYLPADKKKKIKKTSKKNFSVYFIFDALGIYKNYGMAKVALKQAKNALFLDFNKITFLSFIKLCIKITIKYRSNTRKSLLF